MMQTVWQNLMTPGVSITEKLIRTALVYVFLIVGLRLAGKRELSQINPFDLVVLLLLANTVQNAIIGNDNSFIGGIVGAAALLVINGLVVRGLYHYGKLDAIEGKPELLVQKGRLLRHHLEREMITVSELEAAARKQGLTSLAHVQECRLETGGSLTFVARTPTDDDKRHHELVGLLAQMEQRQSLAAKQIAELERKIDGLARA